MSAFVYIVQSLSNSHYYIGSALNPNKRLEEHNKGQNKSTKYNGPWKLVFKQKYPYFSSAKKVEFRLKKLKRRDIIERIIKDGVIKLKISGISAVGSAQRSGR